MTIFFISRHPGAKEWAKRQHLTVDEWVTHLSQDQIRPGDTVIGSLPVNLAAQVCAIGARYLHLSLELPANLRGRELTADTLEQLHAHLEEFIIHRVSNS